jgi:16S rRNA (uracil1498-N3)-methyltransferase
MLVGEHVDAGETGLTLVQGISAAERMDQTLRQTTELGVSRVIPLESERSTVRLDDRARPSKQRRWQRIARSAAEQSGRLRMPEIGAPTGLEDALALVRGHALFLFWEEPGGMAFGEAWERCVAAHGEAPLCATPPEDGGAPCPCPLRPPSVRTVLFIGPEGGFSAAEAGLIEGAGAYAVSLGRHILRTETAAVVACALALSRLGRLGGR